MRRTQVGVQVVEDARASERGGERSGLKSELQKGVLEKKAREAQHHGRFGEEKVKRKEGGKAMLTKEGTGGSLAGSQAGKKVGPNLIHGDPRRPDVVGSPQIPAHWSWSVSPFNLGPKLNCGA